MQSRWLSGQGKADQGAAAAAARAQSTPRTPDVEGMDRDTYGQSLQAMNDSLHDLQSDIHRLAAQHSQIQQMMNHNQQPQQRHNPLDPQPFYISADSPQQPMPPQGSAPMGAGGPPTPQRRTWGQPQGPMTFAQQGGGVIEWGGGTPQRQRWGAPPQQQVRPPMGYGGPQGYYGPDYGSPMRDQWGNPLPPQQPQDPYGAAAAAYGGGNDPNYPYDNNGYSPQQQMGVPNGSPYGPQGQQSSSPYNRQSANSFRLHDSKYQNAPQAANNTTAANYSMAQQQAAAASSAAAAAAAAVVAASRRRLSDVAAEVQASSPGVREGEI